MVSGRKDDFLTLTQKNSKHCDGSAWIRKGSNRHFKTLQMELFSFFTGGGPKVRYLYTKP